MSRICWIAAVLACAFPVAASAQVVLDGTRSPALAGADDLGALSGQTVVAGARLLLRRPADRQARLDELLGAQQDPASPLYHRWLGPAELGHDFGPSPASVATAENWLTAQGFTIGAVSPTRMAISFSGTARAVARAFGASVHAYALRGRQVDALAADPAIPASLSGIVAGLAGLGGSVPEPQLRPIGPVTRSATGWMLKPGKPGARPAFDVTVDGDVQQDVAPADFATIYGINPLRAGASPILGSGQTIAVVEDSDILPADWSSFRASFGLSTYAATLTITHPGCSDPGRTADESEAALDAEWSTAVAPAAAIQLASCSDASGGIQAALQGLVDQSTSPRVISVSFGECESELGAAAAMSWANLVQEGAAEGISIFVSTGDSGSAGCDQNAAVATHGISVNGLASSPYDVAVGGTDFADFATNTVATYWNTSNGSADGSAKSYIPEIPWNDTCANSILASYEGSTPLAFCNSRTGASFIAPGGGGGGASTLFAKPSYQSGVYGIPKDGKRDLPDVVSFAANGLFGHALLYCMSDTAEGGTACNYANGTAVEANSAGGTSFAAPAFAGIQALIDQKKGGTQGNPDAHLYALSIAQGQNYGSACNASYGTSQPAGCVFHDVAEGGNDQACKKGSTACYTGGNTRGVLSTSTTSEADAFSASVGFDLTTGLGSVNVANLVGAF